jgi:hypothetical protein
MNHKHLSESTIVIGAEASDLTGIFLDLLDTTLIIRSDNQNQYSKIPGS